MTSWTLRFALTWVLMMVWPSSAARACTCVGVQPLQALAYADVVFVGTVISREEPPPRYILYEGDSVQVISGGDMIRWRLVASRGWKGEPFDTVVIYSERDEAACGFVFRAGELYLVYAYSMESDWASGRAWPVGTEFPVLSTGLCIRTRELDRATADLSDLGKPMWVRGLPPVAWSLRQNHPNPFNPMTQIVFDLPRFSQAALRVFDATGRLVRTIVDHNMPAGSYTLSWDGRDERGSSVASGVYFYELRAGPFMGHRRMVLLR